MISSATRNTLSVIVLAINSLINHLHQVTNVMRGTEIAQATN